MIELKQWIAVYLGIFYRVSHFISRPRTKFDELTIALTQTNWELLKSNHDINHSVLSFTNHLNGLFEQFVPYFNPPSKPPWANNALRVAKRRRSNAQQKLRSLRNSTNQANFTRAARIYKQFPRCIQEIW